MAEDAKPATKEFPFSTILSLYTGIPEKSGASDHGDLELLRHITGIGYLTSYNVGEYAHTKAVKHCLDRQFPMLKDLQAIQQTLVNDFNTILPVEPMNAKELALLSEHRASVIQSKNAHIDSRLKHRHSEEKRREKPSSNGIGQP